MEKKENQIEEIEIKNNKEINTIYGYGRVSSKGQAIYGYGLEAQEDMLRNAGSTVIFKDTYTGTKMDRPELKILLSLLKSGDTLQVCKLDRLCRTAQEGVALVTELVEKGVNVHILNMGLVNLTPMGRLLLNILAAFAEFERDTIVERFAEGKAIARQDPSYREGRKKKFTKKKVDAALELLETHSFRQVEEITGISKSTLLRAKREKEAKEILES